MSQVVFLIDGFNLYHALVDASRDRGGCSTKWLDLMGLCHAYLPAIQQRIGVRPALAKVYYFSASPVHGSQDKIRGHARYMSCLRHTSVNVELGRFRQKTVFCPACQQHVDIPTEKETDVLIAAKLFEVCFTDECETAVLMTGDSDLGPAVRTCHRLFPEKAIFFVFPYRRVSRDLAETAPESFASKPKSYMRHQLPDPLVLRDGTAIAKPSTW